MKAFLARLTAFDWVKIGLYGTAVCGAITVGVLNTILQPWGVSDPAILALEGKIGSISAVFALIGLLSNTLKNPSTPAGYTPAIVPKPDTPIPTTITSTVVTTAAAIKK